MMASPTEGDERANNVIRSDDVNRLSSADALFGVDARADVTVADG
jgi:hypothetical protein